MEEYIRLINKTEDFINSNLNKNITLEDLAENINMSKFHFHRIFSKYSDETIKQFIVRTKMERSAIYLLVRKDINITEIAGRYGYSDSSSYSKAFKKYYKISPSKFRIARNDMHKTSV
ncbi:helix-turn-helix transcriptional regulator [Miniphocaeibacter massiliensis]|uniref:helix-turn-helix transcriptional regulator n=1 Tax=Miniphocaeibacter massiliensis TaxID=2041841 RepID=UPI000C08836F|nr:AraC family transcriptional regulator [Miniphocaeibacter massiliensis]